jgi:hypothetical protein
VKLVLNKAEVNVNFFTQKTKERSLKDSFFETEKYKVSRAIQGFQKIEK